MDGHKGRIRRIKFPSLLCGRPAFTLAEMLVSMAVSAVIIGVLMSALVSASRHVEYLADYRKAASRVAAVESFLRRPAAYCGLGVPLEPHRYRAAFGHLPYEPFDWEGPICVETAKQQLTGGHDRRADSVLSIAYAQRSYYRASDYTVLGGENDVIRLDQRLNGKEVQAADRPRPGCKSFVCFGASLPPRSPLRVGAVGKYGLSLSAPDGSSVVVLKNDRMWLFRAMTIFTSGDKLYSYDYSGSGRQPRLSGICDVRFRVDTGARKLIVYIMARGDKKYSGRQRGRGMVEWPEEYRSGSFENKENYLLIVEKVVLKLPNCRPSSILDAGSAVEVF